jgi:hypothetical protein
MSAALLITSIVILRSNVFSKKTAYVEILANLTGIAEYAPVPTTSLLFAIMNSK